MKPIIIFFVFSFALLYAQDDDIKNLFPAKWKMDVDKAEVFEEWEIKNEDELVGTSYGIENGEKYISEYLYLKNFGGQWAYIAHPVDQTITLFALIEFSSKKFIFENKEHDFPQRIIYEFHKDGKLTVAIEGDVNGELKRKEFSFFLVEE